MSEQINQIGTIASGLLEYEFDYITGTQKTAELQLISGSLSGRMGELNILLNQSFSFEADGNPYPRLQKEESDILELLYIRDYNTKQAQKLLRGIYDPGTAGSIADSDTPWIELSEGDTTIKRSPGSSGSSAASRITMSKDFKALSEEAREKIEKLVYAYNMYGAEPRQVLDNSCGDASTNVNASASSGPAFNYIAMTTLCEDAQGGTTKLIPCDQSIFRLGDETIIAYGTPYQEPANVTGFGSIILEEATKYFHPKGTTVHIIKRNPSEQGSGPSEGSGPTEGSGLTDTEQAVETDDEIVSDI